MPQFTIPSLLFDSDNATITDRDDIKHISKVLRLKEGDWLILSDGAGTSAKATISKISSHEIVLHFTSPPSEVDARLHHPPVLAQAMVKHDKMEWIIQKSIELGCHKIVPFTCERCIPKYQLKGGQSLKVDRWQKIADGAAKQCGLPFKPEITHPLSWGALIESFKNYDHAVLFWEGESGATFSQFPSETNRSLLIIGPEGGFCSEEVERAQKAGAMTLGLGPYILRTETAAITALTLAQFKRGHFSATNLTL
jgi:16S rRNA (uracil1498-N3)-methyltransferase